MFKLIIFYLLLSVFDANAQQTFTLLEHPEACKAAIQKKHQQAKTISADFTEKTFSAFFSEPQISHGKLVFADGHKIRWEHTEPKKQIILIHQDEVRMKEDGKEVSNPRANRIIQEIQSLMMNLLSGEFLNETDFSISYYHNPDAYKLILLPERRRMSRMVERLELIFDKERALLNQATIFKDENEKVTFVFENVETDVEINNSKFKQF